MYNVKGKCNCCGEKTLCREAIYTDFGQECLYLLCEECDCEINALLNYYGEE